MRVPLLEAQLKGSKRQSQEQEAAVDTKAEAEGGKGQHDPVRGESDYTSGGDEGH